VHGRQLHLLTKPDPPGERDGILHADPDLKPSPAPEAQKRLEVNPTDRLDSESEVGPDLRPRLERLTALRSAWSVLAPSGLSDIAEEIAETGRAVTDYFVKLTRAQDQLDSKRLAGLDALIDEFDMSMRLTASRVPIPRLRSTLPAYLASHRSGLLDLLDVFIGSELEADRSSDGRIYAIDYMITLLCTADAATVGVIQHDPVTLTPRLNALCEHADAANDPDLSDATATFFGAANMDADDLREEIQQRNLRTRKAELGNGFFASSVLRAIVSYNAALIERVADAIVDTGNVAVVKSRNRHRKPGSVYDSKPLRAIAGAIARRMDGEEPRPEPIDRIAWALDLDSLNRTEKRALENEAVCTRENVIGTAIIIGLISRSVEVLSMDIQEAGMSPDEISDGWIVELDAEIQTAINETIASDHYNASCVLAELKQKFLCAPSAEEGAKIRPAESVERQAGDPLSWSRPKERRESASQLVRNALDDANDPKTRTGRRTYAWDDIPWTNVGWGALAAAMTIAALLFLSSQNDRDLDRWSGDELAAVSPYLDQGRRNGSGIGPAFIGGIDDDWLTLPPAEREASAEELVYRLKELGIQQVMIYDSDRTLRIQSIGTQPVRVL